MSVESKPAAGFRMIAIDLDGTLLHPSGRVTDRTREAVLRVVSVGWRVCFATGRNWNESRPVLRQVGHLDTAVFVGGALVVDTRLDRVLHRTTMDGSLAADVCRFFENHGLAALALQDFSITGSDYLISDGLPMDSATDLWMTLTGAVILRRFDLATEPGVHDHTLRISVVAAPAVTAGISAMLTQAFGSRIVFHSIAVGSLGVDVLEVFDPAVSKWQGLLTVAAVHGIDPRQIVAVGDDFNDLPMIKSAGLGVAMGNARAEVKAAAGRVIGSNADDGLAVFLEEIARGG
jgi:hydroxymethylpyrimidine pyrophosphatase-like HAD family hydrolase